MDEPPSLRGQTPGGDHLLHDLLSGPAIHVSTPVVLPELGDDHQVASGDQHLLLPTDAVGLGQGGEGVDPMPKPDHTVSVLGREEGYTVKYGLSPRDCPRAIPRAQALFYRIS